MPLKLDVADVINGVVTDEEISSFTLDEKNAILYIAYDRKDANGDIIIQDATHTLSGSEMAAAIERASEIAGADVRVAIKQALYEYLPGNGVIS